MTEAYKQGYEAAKSGKDLMDNPYPSISVRGNEWLNGFFDASLGNSSDCVMSA